MNNGVALTLLLLLSSLVMAAPPPLGHQLSPVLPPLTAPDFMLPDIDGTEHRLSEFHGKVVMLNFWASWCPPCRREMPSLQRLYEKYRSQGLVVVAINQWEDPDLVFEFIGRLDLEPSFPVLLDHESKVAEHYRVQGLPTTFVLDRDGKICYRAMGGREFDHPEVERLLEGLL